MSTRHRPGARAIREFPLRSLSCRRSLSRWGLCPWRKDHRLLCFTCPRAFLPEDVWICNGRVECSFPWLLDVSTLCHSECRSFAGIHCGRVTGLRRDTSSPPRVGGLRRGASSPPRVGKVVKLFAANVTTLQLRFSVRGRERLQGQTGSLRNGKN